MTELLKLCAEAAIIEGQPLRVVVDGYPPLAVFTFEREYFVTEDTCTHGLASLCDGYQDGEEIECPYHGGVFNIKSGEPVSFPCTRALKVFKTVVRDGNLYIEPSMT
jgi:nitrite reductase/ring-hydroxylating ferredoxin subunit